MERNVHSEGERTLKGEKDVHSTAEWTLKRKGNGHSLIQEQKNPSGRPERI
ncbi:hypothetical protein [Tetragenococcus osmophilus]|uniref:hypothetical protein n=1 Tax=Tetragenococcus osmophilus TaxID=526944 RepID=UPI0024E13DDC|nr:hypothetical protein [Tetragenococcus osmophilus]